VEDELANRQFMEAIVRRLPDTTLLIADGAHRGLRLAAKHAPDVIVMDANPRDMSVTETLARLRRYESTRATPVIAMSTEAISGKVRKGRRAGFLRTVAKPMDADEVVAAIMEVFAKSP
jgi:CheY-like chemotaxis protein